MPTRWLTALLAALAIGATTADALATCGTRGGPGFRSPLGKASDGRSSATFVGARQLRAAPRTSQIPTPTMQPNMAGRLMS